MKKMGIMSTALVMIFLSCDEENEKNEKSGPEWVLIPEGTFEMGCSSGDPECEGDEVPPHTVTVAAFQMTKTEITQEQYRVVTGDMPSYHENCPACPVEGVTWNEATAFCGAIGGRLPSEAEWEYAARAGTTTMYYCGNRAFCLDDISWYFNDSSGRTHEVGQKTPNAFGLYDMLGNVWEWVEDCWHADYDAAPSNGGVWEGGDCSLRVTRGGPYSHDPWSLRASNRHGSETTFQFGTHGFRCAK